MPLPLIFAVSRDPNFSATLQTQLADHFCVSSCLSVDDARRELKQRVPQGFVADFRTVTQGGHAEERFLEDFQTAFPQAELCVLTAQCLPEPIERRLACGGILRFDADAAVADVASFFLENIPGAPATPEPVEVGPAEVAEASPALAAEPDYVVAGLTRRFETNTPRMRMMLSDLEVAAGHDVTVLLIGETGAGKTFLSKLIHEISPRRNEPFLTVACGALPADLIESELFGHSKGAFTSAHADKDGKFVAARRGTILLDEIDVLGLEQQVKLLRVIESGEFEPVGSNRTLKSEARLIVASNVDLQPLVEQGKFRPDLYYRLNMLKFDVLPLRSRRPDVIPLAQKFIQELSAKHGVKIESIAEDLYAALYRYPWPGNVRELEHVIQRAVIYCRDGKLAAHHLPSHVVMCQAGPNNEGRPTQDTGRLVYEPARNSLGQQVAFSEREIIEQALFKNNYSRTGTAKALGISRVTLYNKMKKYGMTK